VKGERAGLAGELEVVKGERAGLAGELKESREEAELCLLQLHQVQEELEHVWLDSQKCKAEAGKQAEFLRAKLSERDALISQYQLALKRLKGVCLDSFQASRFSWPRLAVGHRLRLLRAGKSPKLLSAGTTVKAKKSHKSKRQSS
jgi:hypothetical protein